jgi:hypothetical protein
VFPHPILQILGEEVSPFQVGGFQVAATPENPYAPTMHRLCCLLLAAASLGCLPACRRVVAPPCARQEGYVIGAFDVIKLCRLTNEVGPVYFEHRLHADLRDGQGRRIACAACHHEVKDRPGAVPRGCSKCHLPHDQERDEKPPI